MEKTKFLGSCLPVWSKYNSFKFSILSNKTFSLPTDPVQQNQFQAPHGTRPTVSCIYFEKTAMDFFLAKYRSNF